jgi:hypothetical protein
MVGLELLPSISGITCSFTTFTVAACGSVSDLALAQARGEQQCSSDSHIPTVFVNREP